MPLHPTDYAPLIAAEVLTALAAGSADAQPQAEATARAELAAYLEDRYDVPLALDGDAAAVPPALLRRVWADLALYHLYTHAMPEAVPAVRRTRYTDALAWLQAVSNGTLQPQLPQRRTGAPPTLPPYYLYGSNPKIKHQ